VTGSDASTAVVGRDERSPVPGVRARSWICGDFEGVYVGEEAQPGAQTVSDSSAGGREYTVHFVRGRLFNPRRVSTPPPVPAGTTVVRTHGAWPLDIDLPGGEQVEVQAGETEVHGAVLRLARGYPATAWMQAVLGRQESAGIITEGASPNVTSRWMARMRISRTGRTVPSPPVHARLQGACGLPHTANSPPTGVANRCVRVPDRWCSAPGSRCGQLPAP